MNKYKIELLNLSFYSLVWLLASFFAVFFRYDSQIPNSLYPSIFFAILILVISFYVISRLDRLFFGLPRRSTFEEFFSVARRFTATATLFFLFLLFYPNFILPKSFPILAAILALGLFSILDKLLRFYYQKLKIKSGKIPVIIYGAGVQGQLLLQKILDDKNLDWRPLVIIDDTKKAISKLNGVKIIHNSGLNSILDRYSPKLLIISFSEISNDKLQNIQQICDRNSVQLRIISPIKALTGEEFSVSDIRQPTQEELIGKTSIKINTESLKEFLEKKIILITGAGGSIGSELARQIYAFGPEKLYLLDRDETSLLNVNMALSSKGAINQTNLILADIRDQQRIKQIFEEIKPEIVFHAAALKHLSMLELYPDEAIKTNINGTNNILNQSIASGVNVFVNISTDKAADPTSVLGKTKFFAERLTAGAAQLTLKTSSRFISVRFGNVFGSRGSVFHTFMQQINNGGPITITHPEVSRYFMTIEESVHLLIRAAVNGNTGETLILKMGEPILIKSIADKLIRSSGKNILIEYSSLRPGEKLAEILIGSNEIAIKTEDDSILKITVNPAYLDLELKDWEDFRIKQHL